MALELSQRELRELLFTKPETRSELKDWVHTFLDLELPDCIVDPDSNCTPLDMVWDSYNQILNPDETKSRFLYYAARDSFKTLDQSVLEVLILLHIGGKIIHLAAIKEQSINAQKYLKKFFQAPLLRNFVEGDSKDTTTIVYYRNSDNDDKYYLTPKEFNQLSDAQKMQYLREESSCEIIVATVQSTNGKHGFLFLDELDVIKNPQAYKEAKNIPSPIIKDGKKILPITVLTSTRKSAFGFVQNEIDEAQKTGLVIRHWNLIDVTEACPPSRHRPDLPKLKIYSSDEDLAAVDEKTYLAMSEKDQERYSPSSGYHGCLTNCKIYSVCKTRLATHQKSTSLLLKPISHTQNQFGNNDPETAKAQLLSRKPSSHGLIYNRFDMLKHVLTPEMAHIKIFGENPKTKHLTKAQLIEIIQRELRPQWYGGMDFGYSHNFAYAHGFTHGPTMFVTHALGIPELEPDQQIAVMTPFKAFEPYIFPDTENPQMINLFKKHHFRMRKWKKPLIEGSITVVKAKLNPVLGDPQIYFILDIDPDPHMAFAIKCVREFHWTVDAAGNPTNIPHEDGKDFNDAWRYMVFGVFPTAKSGIVLPSSNQQQKIQQALNQIQQNSNTDWVSKKIMELTGGQKPAPMENRKMVISNVFSYYGSETKVGFRDEEQQIQDGAPKGKKGRLIFDFE